MTGMTVECFDDMISAVRYARRRSDAAADIDRDMRQTTTDEVRLLYSLSGEGTMGLPLQMRRRFSSVSPCVARCTIS